MDNLTIIYEDAEILAVDKPAGITVNKSDTTRSEITLQDLLEKRFFRENIFAHSDQTEDFYKRSGIVHRLDKETSGILLIAKTLHAFKELQRQFKERIVKKTYIALAHGKITPEEGDISVAIGRLPYNRMRFGVVAGGRDAVTKYKVLGIKDKAGETVSFVELYPQTGRTHQIRVHLKYLGHPIVADELYAGRKTARNDRKELNRFFLHATKISFIHPTTKAELTFVSSLPVELQEFYDKLDEG